MKKNPYTFRKGYSLTQAEYNYAFEILSNKYNPIFQRSFAIVLLSRIKERIRHEIDFPYTLSLLDNKLISLIKDVAKNELYLNIEENKYKYDISTQKFLENLNVIINVINNDIQIQGNKYIQQLLEGIAPVQFYNMSREVVENQWKEYKEQNNKI